MFFNLPLAGYCLYDGYKSGINAIYDLSEFSEIVNYILYGRSTQ